MSKVEYVDLAGLRADGRRPHELRKTATKLSVVSHATGSALIEQGNTKVLASVVGPRECTVRSKEMHDKALILVDVSIAAFSSGERRKQRRGDRQAMEVAAMIRQTFEALIFTNLYPKAEISINVEILQADGPVKAVALNAVTLALIDAGIPIKDFLCSCTVGYIDGHSLLDPNNVEESARGPDATVAYLPNSEKVASLDLEPKLPLEALGPVMDLAMDGCRQMYRILQAVVLENCSQLVQARGQVSL